MPRRKGRNAVNRKVGARGTTFLGNRRTAVTDTHTGLGVYRDLNESGKVRKNKIRGKLKNFRIRKGKFGK